MALVENKLCVPGLYIILIYNTRHAVKWTSRNTMHIRGIHHIDSEYITHRYIEPWRLQRYNGPRGRNTVYTWGIHHTDSRVHTTRKVSITNRECIVCVPRVCIIRTHSTIHTEIDMIGRYSVCNFGMHYTDSDYTTLWWTHLPKRVYNARYSIYTWIAYVCLENSSYWLGALHTQLDTLALGEGIVCDPWVSIILIQTIQHTDTMTSEGRYSMCTFSIHHTDLQYTAHR